jgi:hypothetical protein
MLVDTRETLPGSASHDGMIVMVTDLHKHT